MVERLEEHRRVVPVRRFELQHIRTAPAGPGTSRAVARCRISSTNDGSTSTAVTS